MENGDYSKLFLGAFHILYYLGDPLNLKFQFIWYIYINVVP